MTESSPAAPTTSGGGFSRLLAGQGISRTLAWGFIALMLFMVGDGIEQSFLSNYLNSQGVGARSVATLFSVYGLIVAISTWSTLR